MERFAGALLEAPLQWFFVFRFRQANELAFFVFSAVNLIFC
jgi:hypothetical protein